MRKHLAAAGLAAGLAVGAIAGFAFTSGAVNVGAQGDTTTTSAPAGTKGQRPDPKAHIEEALKPLVDDGTLTQAQADKVADALIAARPERGPGGPGGDGPGHKGPGGKGGFGMRGGAGLDAVAKALGLTVDELRTELGKGSSIAEIAKAKGVDVAKIVDAAVADATTKIDEQVANGRITQAQADERIAQLKERITAMINGERPAGLPGRGPGGWGHGDQDGQAPGEHGAPGAPGEAPTTDQTTTTTEG